MERREMDEVAASFLAVENLSRNGSVSLSRNSSGGGLIMLRSLSVHSLRQAKDVEEGRVSLPGSRNGSVVKRSGGKSVGPDDIDLDDTNTPFYDLYVHNLTYQVSVRTNEGVQSKTLLNNITAQAFHGEIMAVVGPSGSGKTTFLDALAGRIQKSSLQGIVQVNGETMDNNFRRISGYVMQDDALFPMLTVTETLVISARLRLPRSMSLAEKLYKVQIMINALGLKQCADTRVGNESVRGISGGERRRVSIGVDVIHDPAVLFLDEPTSGLDSTSALAVMQTLSSLAKKRKRTVILTIHQPSYRILETINRLLVLARGNVIYQGPHEGLVAYFTSLGRVVPERVNVVEYVLDAVEEYMGVPEGLEKLVAMHEKQQVSTATEPPEDVVKAPMAESKPEFASPWLSECAILAGRNFKSVVRTPELFFSRVATMVTVGLTLGTLFLRVHRSEKGIQQRNSFLSFTLAFLIFTSTEALGLFLAERIIYIRETSRGAYRASSYVVAGSIVIMPFLLFLAIIYSSVAYFLVGFVPLASAFFLFVLIVFLVLCASNSFVSFVSGVVPSFTVGNSLVSAIIAYFFLFSGFFISRNRIPKYWIWLHYLSLFKYPYESLLENEYGHQDPDIFWYNDVTARDVLDMTGVGGVHQLNNILILIAFFIGYRFLFFVALRFLTKNIRS